ncbi:MAG: GNAT family N-acetyltransferase [Chlorobi bacterium]|nr:GNAT family N-acetyltransferase [Chlorobiota bacterium]
MQLKTEEEKNKWLNMVLCGIKDTQYGLLSMIKQRVKEHPDKILFKGKRKSQNFEWTYEQVFHSVKETAAFIYKIKPEKPRVALFMSNSVETAVTDLACLSFDIFNTPLNIHFNKDTLSYIIKKTDINIIITDTPQRLRIAASAIKDIDKDIKIAVTDINSSKLKDADFFLARERKKITLKEAEKILAERKIKPINHVVTTMFTSGSTGMPKGVSFSMYNIISKRFARALALPNVGNNEKLICYLPLFHTFGRYLELTGSIFWGGTYVFAGNSSSDTLLSLFPKENPTGFISVPVRWMQLYEACIKKLDGTENKKEQEDAVRSIVGKNLHWGLSAAGYLDPKIFRFFHKHGISLNSGFGMTEATGGITMTPSFEYKENSTGIPLPGIKTQLKKNGELQISGHYVARYLEDAGPDDIIPYPEEEDYKLPTGDIFRIDKDGHHEIIDRVKDIYKNNKGQTVAPLKIEKKFTGVPGIKKTFLVGDGKPYNVLLIVPDKNDPVMKASSKDENINEYFHQIVMTANKDLAPYERVINFSILERDFSKEKGELTPKGSFKRKIIEKNFAPLIKDLYKSNHITFNFKSFKVLIPRWFYRDIGILETDIIKTKKGLYNKTDNKYLRIEKTDKKNIFTIGDLNYTLNDPTIDLGRLIRQPKLWTGNPELINFSPCKASYDTPFKNFAPQISLPENNTKTYKTEDIEHLPPLGDFDLIVLNRLISQTLHGETKTVLKSLKEIETIFGEYEKNKAEIIRRRLEALAYHKNENIRIEAYRILLTKDPEPDFAELLPAFINSGKTFLNEYSINLLAKSSFSLRQLDILRKRMFIYRTTINWPADKNTIKQFDNIFKLLLKFGINHPKYYKSLRAEFASWILLKKEPVLSKKAKKYFFELYEGFEKYITKKSGKITENKLAEKLIFDDGITDKDQKELISKLAASHTLKQAIFLIYDDFNFKFENVPEKGIWVSRIKSYRDTRHYRMSINTFKGKHYNLHISIDKTLKTSKGLETLFRQIALAGYPFDLPVVPRFGCSNHSEKISISSYLSMLTAWDKIRTLAEVQASGHVEQANTWRKIYIRSVSAFYKAWDYGGREILPGFISPNNTALPENDFSDNALIISLSGWRYIENKSSLFSAIYQNYYRQVTAHYPILKRFLKIRWIFHACIEAFGKEKGLKILKELYEELNKTKTHTENETIIKKNLNDYLKTYKSKEYLPLALFNAIDRYTGWKKKNPAATPAAKHQTISELYDLYALKKYPEIVRYRFYRDTYFKEAEDDVKHAFDKLLDKMTENINMLPVQLTELSGLQEALKNKTDKKIFEKMVFPDIKRKQKIDIMTVGKKDEEHVIVKSILKDKDKVEYIMREPLEAAEVGELYKLFYKENYPKEISKPDKHYIVLDSNELLIGGLCYKELEENVVLIDGMAVTSTLQGKGIGSAMMEDFFTRMKMKGKKIIKAHFLFGNYYLKHNFVIDKKWGALVKEL